MNEELKGDMKDKGKRREGELGPGAVLFSYHLSFKFANPDPIYPHLLFWGG